MTWKVLRENINARKIEFYDIFADGYWENIARELKHQFPKRKKWESRFRLKLKSMYWLRAEYEVAVTSWPDGTIERKIDIFQQLDENWEHFINYVWESIEE